MHFMLAALSETPASSPNLFTLEIFHLDSHCLPQTPCYLPREWGPAAAHTPQ